MAPTSFFVIAALAIATSVLSVSVQPTSLDALTERVFPEYCSGTAKYKIKFDYNWTSETNPNIDFPTVGPVDGPGFAPLVYASHNKYWTMWAPSGFANRGPEQAAEGGNPAQILREMNRERNIFEFGAADGPVAATSVREVEVEVYGPTGQTYLSAMSMIAPSSDWFVGIYNVDMCYRGAWINGPVKGELFGYDAGSSVDGEQFTDFVDPRRNQRPLEQIERLGEDFRSFGEVTIFRVG